MVKPIILALLAKLISVGYGWANAEEQWVSNVELSGAFRIRGVAFASISTPEGKFLVEKGRSAAGYKLIELDLSKSRPSALIQKGGNEAWVGLRAQSPNPVNHKIPLENMEGRGGRLYVKGDEEPLTGTVIDYRSDGSKWETPYLEGKQHGTEIKYRGDGSKSFEMPYVDGKQDGTAIMYNEDGSKRWETPYANGKPHGIAIEYNENGSKSAEYVFENGEEISRKKF